MTALAHKFAHGHVTYRREFERVKPSRNFPVQVNINGNGFIEVTNAVDISEGGVRLMVKHRFAGCEIDCPVSLILHLPAPISKNISVMGKIRHVANDSFGVQFLGMSAVDRVLLHRYAETRRQPLSFGEQFKRFLRNLMGAG